MMGKILKGMMIFLIAAILIGAGLFVWARYLEPSLLIVREESMTAPVSQSTRIVFFSDTHFGKWYSPGNIDRVVEKINEQNPDVVIFGGDFFDIYARDKDEIDLEEFSQKLGLIEAPLGKYAVWGNHDYGAGASRIYQEMMEDGGFCVLKNEIQTIEECGITLYGLDDAVLSSPDTDAAFAGDGTDILICHEPDIADQMDLHNVELVLSGHSHGGQVSLPYLTERALPPWGRKYIKGSYPLENGMRYVSSGIGMTKLPFRFGNIPEIIVINLHPFI